MQEEEMLSVEQAQAHLGVSRATLWNLVKRHQIPRYSIPLKGKRVFFRPEDLDKLREPVRRNGAAHEAGG